MRQIVYLLALTLTVSCVHKTATPEQKSRQIVAYVQNKWHNNHRVISLDSVPDVKEYLQALDSAIYYDSGNVEAYYLKDDICSATLQYEKRTTVLLSLLNIYPFDTDIMYALAQNYYMIDNIDSANIYYCKTIQSIREGKFENKRKNYVDTVMVCRCQYFIDGDINLAKKKLNSLDTMNMSLEDKKNYRQLLNYFDLENNMREVEKKTYLKYSIENDL
ncbi:MAG: hypothetical protein PHD21_03425 [Flavobacteriales bacterium]|nr:hypothetical protein [Flavobacteriales bacterium]